MGRLARSSRLARFCDQVYRRATWSGKRSVQKSEAHNPESPIFGNFTRLGFVYSEKNIFRTKSTRSYAYTMKEGRAGSFRKMTYWILLYILALVNLGESC